MDKGCYHLPYDRLLSCDSSPSGLDNLRKSINPYNTGGQYTVLNVMECQGVSVQRVNFKVTGLYVHCEFAIRKYYT